jgi:hypothetical protein
VPDLTPLPSVQRPSDSAYQPVSGYAVAAVVFAGVFALILIWVGIQTVLSSRAALESWFLALPIAGIVLAVIARSHIRNSEGTRTGLRLASAAWWISVLGGVGFAAYLYANSLAIEYESGKFGDQMFRELQKGTAQSTQSAFENYFVPPEERGRVPANAGPDVFEAAYVPSGYGAFRNHDVVRMCLRNPGAVNVERVKVKDSGQDATGLYATHVYRLTTPEGIFECQVKLVAAEAKKGGKPMWRIPAQPAPNITLGPIQLSRYGKATIELLQDAEMWVHSWTGHLGSGHVAWAQMFTTAGAGRRSLADALMQLTCVGGGPAMSFPAGPQFLPADRAAAWERRVRAIGKTAEPGAANSFQDLPFDDLAAIGFFRRDDSGTPLPDEKLGRIRELWRSPRLVVSDPRGGMMMDQTPPLLSTISVSPDRIRVIVFADLFEKSGNVHFRCAIAVDCTDPAVLAAINAAQKEGANAKDDDSLTRTTLPARDWNIVWLRTDMEPIVPAGPGGRAR